MINMLKATRNAWSNMGISKRKIWGKRAGEIL